MAGKPWPVTTDTAGNLNLLVPGERLFTFPHTGKVTVRKYGK